MSAADPVTRHYNDLLATQYSWMSGLSFDEKVAEQQELLAQLGIDAAPNGLAVDLGSGPGYQSCALANLGFEKILAIDTSRQLLDELEASKSDLPIRTIQADLRDFTQFVGNQSAGAIVCMGDTLTHLENHADVTTLLRDAYDALRPGGRFVLTFRDFSTELHDLDRIIPVRSDNDRIMMCILDYESKHVVVTDVVHVRQDNTWTLQKSSYRKLRLAPAQVVSQLQEIGFVIDHNKAAGRMHAISARKQT